MDRLNVAFPGPIIFGKGIISEIGSQTRELGCRSVLVVGGPITESLGFIETITRSLRRAGVSITVYKDSHQNPTDRDVESGLEMFKRNQCDGIVAVGGGSRLDVAKAIRLLASHPSPLERYYFDVGGAANISLGMPPLVCVPTTAGSGSETSRGAIITDTAQKRKRLVVGPGMMASLAILDPELSVSMSPRLSAETGIDALSHALESYVGTNYNPFASALALNAAGIIFTALPQAVEQGQDLGARSDMLLGSAMAAMGFAKGLGVVHSLAHQLSTQVDVSHGLAISVLLPHGIDFNIDAAPRQYCELAAAMGISRDGLSEKDTACRLVRALDDTVQRFALPTKLRDLGIARGDIREMGERAMLDHCHATNPRPCSIEDMVALLEKAF
jgi:4-hydroxybutyrate dehydrogenase